MVFLLVHVFGLFCWTFPHVCLCTRANLSTCSGLVKSWRPTPQSTSLQDRLQACRASSETTACWVKSTSYSFCTEPRSAKEKCKMESWYQKAPFSIHGKKCLTSLLSSPSGVCRPWVPLRGSSSHWGDHFRLRLPSTSLQSTSLFRQWFLQREAYHKTGLILLNPLAGEKTKCKSIDPVWIADHLSAPIRTNIHRRTPCVDRGCLQ